MPKNKPVVVVTRRLPDTVETRMMELFDARLDLTDEALGTEGLEAAVAVADVLVPTVTDRLTRDVIAAAGPQLKLIANYGTGVDHIDLAACDGAGIVVTNTPDVLTQDTADMTMALILAVPRRLAGGDAFCAQAGGRAGRPPGCWAIGRAVSAWASSACDG